ncbi:hypothetical protein MN116_004593 [Schistosoma mekongi]|uniref:Uncharacterized protein n=1 Tax=Schistosoma mekongi TaxID=38744 RepID=A0AAE1ZCF0_SCHME|nr:hypothetical protein MN116_004593 [Schistosoma mekongi]
MLYEKEITHDLRNFQRLCKEKRQLLLQTYINEEKELNEVYAKNYNELLKSHKKQLDNLHIKVEKRKNKLRKNIERELRIEKKNLKKLYNRKSPSINHVTQSNDYPVSSISLNNLPTSIHSNNNDNDNQSLNTSLQLPITTLSSSLSLNQLRNNVIRRPRQLYSLNKQLSKSDYALNTVKNNSAILEYENNLQNVNDELEERFYHYSMDAKNSIAELEWKCLLERQELKRTYLHNLGELKQRRIMSLGNLARIQTKTYYDLQRKWLCQLHTHELNLRNTSCQVTLKKLTDSQSIERQTICKLLNESIKGQKQILQILENLLKNDKQLNKTESKLMSINHTTYNTTHNLLSTINEQQTSTNLLEQLMESPYFIIEEYSSDDFTEGITKYQSTPTLLSNVDTSLNDNNHIEQLNDTTNAIDYPLKQSTSHSLQSKIIEISNSNQHEKQQSNDIMNKVKSNQSIHSTISAYESLSRTVLNIITTRQSDFWTSILEQEHLLTENLLKGQTEQLKLLITSENAAVKRCQMDYDSRAAYLAVTLEATRKFAEKEFSEERERTIQFYFPNSNTNQLHTSSRYQSINIPREHSSPKVTTDNLHDTTYNNNNNNLKVSNTIKKFEQYTDEHGNKIIPITFKSSSSLSSKFNLTSDHKN